MPPRAPVRAVVFDLDGTLVDSAADVAMVLNTVLGGRYPTIGTFAAAEVRGLMGHGLRATIEKAVAARGLSLPAAEIDRLNAEVLRTYAAAPVVHTRPFPGAIATLRQLQERKCAVGVCTNKAGEPATLVLRGTGLAPLIDALVAGDSGHGLKPDPAPLRAVMALLGARPEETVYVGDHAIDVATARAAGVPVVFARYGYGTEDRNLALADATIDSLSDLPAALDGAASIAGGR